ncbi:MAG TPA: aminopeptidase [Rhodospirillaceae bacterium]|nr:aminopeptidase [Rhodospirillaceae bacterium]
MTTEFSFSGADIFALAEKLFPLHRSITGNGVRRTHDVIQKVVPELVTREIPSGTKCFDWTIPNEWNITEAYIANMEGERIVDLVDNNLHVMSYSSPVDDVMDRDALMPHLISLPDMPDAIPFVTSYFDDRWAFCLTENQKRSMRDDKYRVVIRSTLAPGSMTYGEIQIPGDSKEEILIHTYTCHPSMGNNETSGMAVTAYLARAILDMPRRHYSYRIVYVPETIGAVAYISLNLETLRKRIVAGFIMTCVGDDRTYSLMPSRQAETLPERAARYVLENILQVPYDDYTYLDRGSDERQYCAPGVDLPVVSIMRSKYGTYPEYHTSLDDLSVLSADGLWGGFLATFQAIQVIERNETLAATVLCEPWLSPRGLRAPLADGKFLDDFSKKVSHLLAYSDGETDLLAISTITKIPFFELALVAEILKEQDLLRPVDKRTRSQNQSF